MKNGFIIDSDGTKRYYLNGKLHRIDGPAEEYANGFVFWWLHGKKHRVDGPAMEWTNGTKSWWLNGKRHRKDGPAVEYQDGQKTWWVNGELHRVDGPAQEYINGNKYWYLHNKPLIRPKEFETMEAWFQKLNTDENYSLPWINDINGLFEVIKNPTPKQKRLNAMKWKI